MKRPIAHLTPSTGSPRVLVVGLLVLLLPGCAVGGTVSRPAAPFTEAERADSLAMDFAESLTRSRQQKEAGAVVAAVVNGEAYRATWASSLQLLRMDGGTNTTEGATIEVRISPDGPQMLSDHCYRYLVKAWGVDRDYPQRVRCGEREALPFPGTTAPARIAADADVRVRQALSAGVDGAVPTVAEVQAALTELVDERGHVDVADAGSAIGVAVFVPAPSRDCLMARRLPDGQVETWRPDEVLVAAGEASCDAATAAAGGAQGHPH